MTNSISNNAFLERRNSILAKINEIAKAYGRNPNEINLVAACKTQDQITIENAINSGQKIFGENKVQEGYLHFSTRDNSNLELRLIGPLQSNKAQDAIKLFDVIETLDRLSLAKELAKSIQKLGKTPKFLAQVNIGEEEQKAGINPNELDKFITELSAVYGIRPIGLMCIPPNNQPPAPYFALLQKMAKENGLEQLSMGMSADFETAIKFGATHIRIGTSLFGAREYL